MTIRKRRDELTPRGANYKIDSVNSDILLSTSIEPTEVVSYGWSNLKAQKFRAQEKPTRATESVIKIASPSDARVGKDLSSRVDHEVPSLRAVSDFLISEVVDLISGLHHEENLRASVLGSVILDNEVSVAGVEATTGLNPGDVQRKLRFLNRLGLIEITGRRSDGASQYSVVEPQFRAPVPQGVVFEQRLPSIDEVSELASASGFRVAAINPLTHTSLREPVVVWVNDRLPRTVSLQVVEHPQLSVINSASVLAGEEKLLDYMAEYRRTARELESEGSKLGAHLLSAVEYVDTVLM